MGTAGLVGPINAYNALTQAGVNPGFAILEIVLLCFVFPAALSWGIGFAMKKMGVIKPGDMKL